MRPLSTATLALALAVAQSLGAQSPITPGNLIVTRVGDGAATLSSAASAVFLEEFTTTGTPVQTIAMPTVAAGSDLPVTNSGSATSEGFVTQSVDGRYLITVGYAATPGTAAVTGTSAATVARVIARIALDGTIDSSTGLADAYTTTGNIRSAVSLDGNQFWTAGTGGAAANRGVCYVAGLGATTSVQLSSTPTNCRVVGVFGDQLFMSANSGAFVGLNTIGTGLPTGSGETTTLLNGFTSPGSAYDFWFADASTVYVADDRTNGLGGIQKWTESAGTWTLAYTLATAANVGCRGLSGISDLGGTTLYATTTANELVSVLDTGVGATFNLLTTGATNTALRGVRFVRTPYDISFGGTSCPTSVGVPTIGTTGGAPVSGNANFAITVGNAPDLVGPGVGVTFYATAVGVNSTLFPVGIPLPDAPACALLFAFPDILFTGLTDAAGEATIPLSLAPADASLWGLPVPVQNFAFDFTGFYAGLGLPVGSSVGMQLILGN